ncbi:hypothetical protein WJX84_006187 [Apatococcus fuscideae]|uniref:Uncharacterized protein n=1 Tax=Apatococcus fuscideae TaxID=2026836 RepID=A0AAW1SSR0_9CHLO
MKSNRLWLVQAQAGIANSPTRYQKTQLKGKGSDPAGNNKTSPECTELKSPELGTLSCANIFTWICEALATAALDRVSLTLEL